MFVSVFALVAVAAAWSQKVYVHNSAAYTMTLIQYNLTKGSWRSPPPQTIAQGQNVMCESDGGTLGTTAGGLWYQVGPNGPQVYMSFSVSSTSTNYNIIAIPPSYGTYRYDHDRDGAVVQFAVTQKFDGNDAAVEATQVVNASSYVKA